MFCTVLFISVNVVTTQAATSIKTNGMETQDGYDYEL